MFNLSFLDVVRKSDSSFRIQSTTLEQVPTIKKYLPLLPAARGCVKELSNIGNGPTQKRYSNGTPMGRPCASLSHLKHSSHLGKVHERKLRAKQSHRETIVHRSHLHSFRKEDARDDLDDLHTCLA